MFPQIFKSNMLKFNDSLRGQVCDVTFLIANIAIEFPIPYEAKRGSSCFENDETINWT
jgi:hypothetical protein